MGQPGVFAIPGQPTPAAPFGAAPMPGPDMTQPMPGQAIPPKPQAPRPASTQNSLLLSELRENMVIMADGSFRAVVACKSINFDLMSSREREGVEFSYQNFLNALYFPIQIFIRSQRVDIGPYIDRLEEVRRTQENMLLSVLMDDYINFIDALSQEANIMDKSFFIVVPFFPSGDATNVVEKGKGFLAGFLPNKGVAPVTKIDKTTYDKAKEEIGNRVEAIMSGLAQVGVSAVQLTTKELGELYYNVYNPDTAVR
jgi:type IV secretory pathway VirB4 component